MKCPDSDGQELKDGSNNILAVLQLVEGDGHGLGKKDEGASTTGRDMGPPSRWTAREDRCSPW
eukprot:729046-Hanusia_phi.AAC.6